MQYIDIGVNLTNKRLRFDAESIIQQAQEVGVEQCVVTGTNVDHSKLAIELCETYPTKLYSTAGVHPHDASEWNEDTEQQIKALLAHDCVRAVGETGLDFNRDFSPREQQLNAFEQQIEIAMSVQKPVFLHQRDAFDSFYSLLKQYRDKLVNAVAHCFTDDKKTLYALLDLDCHIGITGWICDSKRGRDLQGVVKDIPADRLMLETDAPYLLPRDMKPKPSNSSNYPHYLPHIAETVAFHQNKAPEQLAHEVFNTTRQFFDI